MPLKPVEQQTPERQRAAGIMSAVFKFLIPAAVAFLLNPPLNAADMKIIRDQHLRTEIHEPNILRIWFKPGQEAFKRNPSLALRKDTMPATNPTVITSSEEQVKIDAYKFVESMDGKSRQLTISDQEGGRVSLAHVALEFSDKKKGWLFRHSLSPDTVILGLGEDNRSGGRLNRRGTVRELWAGQQINSGNVTAEYPVPFYILVEADGTATGIFIDNVHRLTFDLGKSNPNELTIRAEGGEADFYLIPGPGIAEVIEGYTSLTGRPSLPPLWALGYWQSKCTYWNWPAFDEAYTQLTNRGFPVDVMVIDYDWAEFLNNFQWAEKWYQDGADPAEKLAVYREKGVKVVLSQSGPMIKEDSPTFATGMQAGIFADDGKGNPVECGHYGGKLLDFTHPGMNDWLHPQLSPRIREGVAGWWLDLTEPEGEPPQTQYFGGNAAEIHNQYSLRCALSFEEAQLKEYPGRRPFILTRTGSAGIQAHHTAVWTGDVYSDYPTLQAHAPEMLNSGLSGLAWWTSDCGGFMSGYYKDDPDGAHGLLYERWMQFSVFSPITRAHKAGGHAEPYQFGPEVEEGCRHYLNLRYRLLPYIYSYAWEASRTGLPLTRPMILEYSEEAEKLSKIDDQYLFGREMLIAPVLHENKSNRQIYLPAGTMWYDWDYGYEYEGGREWVVKAPQHRIPILIRAGAIIPMAPAMRNTSERSLDFLILEVFPHGKSHFTHYDDDGKTFDYRNGKYTLTQFTSELRNDVCHFQIKQSNVLFRPESYQLNFHLKKTPQKVSINGETISRENWQWDKKKRILSVPCPLGKSLLYDIEISIPGKLLELNKAPEIEVCSSNNPEAELVSSSDRPVPHFFPPPALPGRIKAVNYDKGGEGVAFHGTPETSDVPAVYRRDAFCIAESSDVGGGYDLSGLQQGDWTRYTIDAVEGGWFNIRVRVANGKGEGQLQLVAQNETIATINIPETGGTGQYTWQAGPKVWLNPGVQSLLLYVNAPISRLNTMEFTRIK